MKFRKKAIIFLIAISLILLGMLLNFYFKLHETRIGANFICIGIPFGQQQNQCIGYPYIYLHADPIAPDFDTESSIATTKNLLLEKNESIRKFPSTLAKITLEETYTFNNIDYAIFQKGTMNVPSNNESSGILYANKTDTIWKIFTLLKEPEGMTNNIYYLDYQNGNYYTLVVDATGAGSGEGVGKLMSLQKNTKLWKLEKCFYYGMYLEKFWEILNSTKNLPTAIDTYIKSFPSDTSLNGRKESCSNFQLVAY